MTLQELRPHLHSLPAHPSWIPYRTSYYKESWGFCVADEALRSLRDDSYDVLVDTSLEDGSLTYAECVVAGETDDEVLVYTHTCHPSLANDNASGLALTTLLAAARLRAKPRLTHRFVFGPGTIGSITWLARNRENLARIRHGLAIGLVGDAGGVSYKRSRHGDRLIDRAARHVLRGLPQSRILDFSPYGYDERQFCSPGIDLAFGRLTRSNEGGYPEYHTSADNLALVRPAALAESFTACSRILDIVDRDARYLNLQPMCEPQLGKRGLYRVTGGENLPDREFALLWVLNQSDGGRDLLGISERSGLPFEAIASAASELESADLLRRLDSSSEVQPGGLT
jgi:aminopeptidase-like protein